MRRLLWLMSHEENNGTGWNPSLPANDGRRHPKI